MFRGETLEAGPISPALTRQLTPEARRDNMMKKYLIVLLCVSFFLGNPTEAAILGADSNKAEEEIYLTMAAAGKNNMTTKKVSQNKSTAKPKSEKAGKKTHKISAGDFDLLARLVHAEAKGEPYAGKIAVAATVLNRVKDPYYPDTIPGVIYQYNGGYQYCPVRNGEINKPADAESFRAVEEALAGKDPTDGALSFFNPSNSFNSWIRNRSHRATIGNHVFVQ